LTAFLLITVGTTIASIYGDFSIFVDSHFLHPANLMIAIGVILMLVAAVGCFGALKESTMIINIVSFYNSKMILINLIPNTIQFF
jgi:ABC-type dipeptide/oligopeptide/nickel transport system permease subunit